MRILSELSIMTNMQNIRKCVEDHIEGKLLKLAFFCVMTYLYICFFFHLFGCSHHRVHLISPRVDKRTSSRTAIGYTRNYLLSRRDNHVS